MSVDVCTICGNEHVTSACPPRALQTADSNDLILALGHTVDTLRASLARAEAELARQRPVVEAAVTEFRAADAANDEEQPNETQVARNGAWTKAEMALHIATRNYLASEPKEPR